MNHFLFCEMHSVLFVAQLKGGLVDVRAQRLGVQTALGKDGSCSGGLAGGLSGKLA